MGMVSASVQWALWPWASGSWYWLHEHRGCHTRYQYRLHGYRVPPEQDATHGIGIDCMDMGIMAMGIWFMVSVA